MLPLAWPGLHRADGTVLIGTQSGNASGDASRDLAGQLLAALAAEPGHPVVTTAQVTADSPRLQDVLVDDAAFEVTVHEGFDFWVEGQDLEADAAESLERANATVVPTAALTALPSAYWVRIGERAHIRLVLPDDEDAATDALARLHAAGDDALGGRDPPARRLPRLRPARAGVGPRPRARGRRPRGRARRVGRAVRRGARLRRLAHRRRAPGPLGPAEPSGHPPLMSALAARVAAVVPCKDEAERIAATVAAVAALPQVGRVVVVDDGSSDGTAEAARAAGADVVRHERNRGKAAALRPGSGGCASWTTRMPSPTPPRRGRRRLLFVDGDLQETAANLGVLATAVLERRGRHDHRDPARPDHRRGWPRARRRPGPARHRAPHRFPCRAAAFGHALREPRRRSRRPARWPAAGGSRPP